MFWGLIMEPERRYTQLVKKAFHISMAALDISTSGNESAQVMCGFEGRNYLLCTLRKPDMVQCPLDLNFDVGSEVSFATNGACHVHLTGYITEIDEDMDEEGEEEEEEEEVDTLDIKTALKSNKRNKQAENGPPNKKSKISKQLVSSSQKMDEDDSDELDDSDFEVDLTALAEDSKEVYEDESGDQEEDDSEDSEGESEDEEESEDDEDNTELEVEIVSKKKPNKVNGVDEKVVKKQAIKNEQQKQSPKDVKGQKPKKRTLQNGVIIEDIKEGKGTPAKNGKFVRVYYEGRLKQNNKLFDSTTKGAGFSFRLGHGEVIKGWDVGVVGMLPGGKRRIICPPSMAYGQKGSPPAIPPNSTLIFEVEMKKTS